MGSIAGDFARYGCSVAGVNNKFETSDGEAQAILSEAIPKLHNQVTDPFLVVGWTLLDA